MLTPRIVTATTQIAAIRATTRLYSSVVPPSSRKHRFRMYKYVFTLTRFSVFGTGSKPRNHCVRRLLERDGSGHSIGRQAGLKLVRRR